MPRNNAHASLSAPCRGDAVGEGVASVFSLLGRRGKAVVSSVRPNQSLDMPLLARETVSRTVRPVVRSGVQCFGLRARVSPKSQTIARIQATTIEAAQRRKVGRQTLALRYGSSGSYDTVDTVQ